MSHFTVMVIGDDPEAQLAPFNEELETPRFVLYTKQEAIENGKHNIETYKNSVYAEYLSDPEKYEKEHSSNPSHVQFIKVDFPQRLNWTDEEIYQREIADYDPKDIGPEGEIYSTRNPDAKWDWYQLGGRWTGMLKLKNGRHGRIGEPGIMTKPNKIGYVDQTLKKDIDFEAMAMENFEHYSKLYEEFLQKWNTDKKKVNPYFDYNIENKGTRDNFVPETKEEYVKRNTSFHTFAVIKDGEWYEKGEMGWWGVVIGEKKHDEWQEQFRKLLDSLPDDTLISIYDCHI